MTHLPHIDASPTDDDGHEIILRVRNLVTRFGLNLVHDGLELDMRRGEILGVVGGSGTGKSVLLKTILGLMHPQSADIEIGGIPQEGLSDEDKIEERQRWPTKIQFS